MSVHVAGTPFVANALSDDDQRAQFERDGFLKLRKLFTADAIAGIAELAEQKVMEQAQGYGADDMRIAYRLHEMPHMQALLQDPGLRQLLTGLTRSGLVPAESQAFELKKAGTGVPWHYGYISYGYIRARDMGYTLWIPLGDIDADETGGGMAYVPEHLISARHHFDMGSLLAPALLDDTASEQLLHGFDDVHQAMIPLFEEHKVEDSFEVGDALLFNKYVWHRSSPYRGDQDLRRLGVAMRFVEDTACVDRVRWTAEYRFGGGVGTGQRRAVMEGTEDRYTRFADIADGAEVRTSKDVSIVL